MSVMSPASIDKGIYCVTVEGIFLHAPEVDVGADVQGGKIVQIGFCQFVKIARTDECFPFYMFMV